MSQRQRVRDEVDGEKQRAGSRDKDGAQRKERSVVRNEDDVGGRDRVTRGEQRVLRGG